MSLKSLSSKKGVCILNKCIYRRNFRNKVRVYRATLSLSWRIRNRIRIRSRFRNVLKFWIRIRKNSFLFRNPASISTKLTLLGSYFEIHNIFMTEICLAPRVWACPCRPFVSSSACCSQLPPHPVLPSWGEEDLTLIRHTVWWICEKRKLC